MVKTRDLDKITFHSDPWKPIHPRINNKLVYGWDTETHQGKAFLLTFSNGNFEKEFHIKDFNDIIQATFHKNLREGINFFFNVDFDFQSITKHLGPNKLTELAKAECTTYEDYLIEWVPKKAFIIQKQKSHHNSLKFYDEMQFYKSSLKDAARLVGLEKKEFDTGAINFNKFQNDSVYRAQLIDYALYDAKICQKLGERLHNAANYIIPITHYYSTASIAQSYFLAHIPHKLNTPPKKIIEIALNSYNGGRFELIKRGYFSNISEIDINSAYPYEISQLVETDTKTGVWKSVTEYNPESIYGFYKVEVETHSYTISPILHRIKNMICYPHGKHTTYIEKSEFSLLLKMGFTPKILEGYEYYDTNPFKPFNFINILYQQRLDLRKQGKEDLQYILKIIMNSGYGKMIQLKPNKSLTDKIEEGTVDELDVEEIECDTGEILFSITNGFKAGPMFNPIFASAITARTRSKLIETVLHYNLEKNLIGFATDCLFVKGNIPQELVGDGLGKWKLEVSGTEGLFIGSGVYSLKCYRNKKDCKMKEGICLTHDKNHMRGFPTRFKLFDEIISKFTPSMNGIKFEINGPIKLKEGVRGALLDTTEGEKQIGWEDIGVFMVRKKFMDLNFDKKRIWDYSVDNPRQLLENEIGSTPLMI